MCSFALSNKKGLLDINEYARKRGPDYTSNEVIEGIEIIHNLLHITGDKVSQPFKKNNCICVFNGEIYNYKKFGNYKTDGECIIDLYEKYEDEFAREIDGEYSIVIIDFNKNCITSATDCFGTKPLWYCHTDNFGYSSFKYQLEDLGLNNVYKQLPNTTNVYNLSDRRLIKTLTNYNFNLNQYKSNFDDWVKAFQRSITKRTLTKNIFCGLSSGLDSGAIVNEMSKQGIDFLAFSLMENESKEILENRIKRLSDHIPVVLDYELQSEFLNLKNDEFDFKSSKTSFGIFNVFRKAREIGKNVFITGHGADEIISDYGYKGKKIYEQSTTGGVFPEKLKDIFPWKNFYKGTQEIYISKEESIASYFGIETRYPYLDTELVQEFLWLSSDLKNRDYKGCIQHYLKANDYPYAMEKIGWPSEAYSLI